MRNHAIDLLERELETLEKSLNSIEGKNMTMLIQEDIADVELAIHNLKMLEKT